MNTTDKLRRRYLAQLAMLDEAMSRADRKTTATAITPNPTVKYDDNAGWIGWSVLDLACKGILEIDRRIGSPRPSRNGTEIKVWRVVDDDKANRYRQFLRTWLEHNPPLTPLFTDTLFPEFLQQISPVFAAPGGDAGERGAHQ